MKHVNLGKLPIYIHVPKNAGTFVQSVLKQHFIRTRDVDEENTYRYYRKVTVETPVANISVHCMFKTEYWRSDPHMKRHPLSIMRNVNNPRAGWCTWDTFETYMKNYQLDILFVSVEPILNPESPTLPDLRCGYFIALQIAKCVGKQPQSYISLREPYNRQQSIYHYIRGSESTHEPSHGSLISETFEDYIMSPQLEDSWLIRCMSAIPNQQHLNEYWLQHTMYFLQQHEFQVYDIKQTEHMLNDIVSCVHECSIVADDLSKAHENKTSYIIKTKFADLQPEAKVRFNQVTRFDRMLYNTYCK